MLPIRTSRLMAAARSVELESTTVRTWSNTGSLVSALSRRTGEAELKHYDQPPMLMRGADRSGRKVFNHGDAMRAERLGRLRI